MLLLQQLLSMRSPLRLAVVATLTALLTTPSLAQTSTSCNPLDQTCPPDPALGTSTTIDFGSGESNAFTQQGSPAVTYDSTNGAAFTVSAAGDAPQLNSNWYIMFGKYEVTMKVAPGTGIVSSIVLESNDLDEIDWEMLGAQPEQAQSNYFGKGQTTTYNRGAIETVSSNTQENWHVYGVEWTSEEIVWTIDGANVRVLSYADAHGQFPQTPCQLKLGVWAGGDPSNPPGTISWAGGDTDYSDGPFTMYVKSVAVWDYSSGTEYKYGNDSGEWESIESVGGRVNGNAPADGGSDTTAPAVTATASGSVVIPWEGSGPTTTIASTNYPGLPSGWTVNPNTGKVSPPSAAPAVEIPIRFAYFGALAVGAGLLLGVWM